MPKRVLVVDDERHIVRLLEHNLKRAGYEVITAFEGVGALSLIRSERPDLVVLDVELPGMDGYEILAQVRNSTDHRDTIVVMIAARTEDIERGRKSIEGWDHCVQKPFDPQRVVKQINELFRKVENPIV